jgi:molybdopterin molybdotransferase
MISFDEAQRLILETTLPKQAEEVPLLDAQGRVLAESLHAPFPFPRFTNSAMDGYAFMDPPTPGETYPCVGESSAGSPFSGSLNGNECIRISTGAKVPKECRLVIPREKVEKEGNTIKVTETFEKGFALRFRGEDVQQGEVLLAKGTLMGAAEIGFLSMYNFSEITVWKKPRIAVLTSGAELKELGEPLLESEIIAANLYATKVKLEEWGCEVKNFGISPDDPVAFQKLLQKAADWSDLVISSAGVSVGEHDVVPLVTEKMGALRKFWKVAVRPGKPTLFCYVGETPYLAFPGNPVAVMVGLEVLIKPLLRKHFDYKPVELEREILPLESDFFPDKKRHFFAIGKRVIDQEQSSVRGLPHQSSGNLSNVARGDCLIELEPSTESLKKGAFVKVIRLTRSL